MQGSTMKQRLTMWLALLRAFVLVLAVAWAAILWTRPEPIRIAFANSLSGRPPGRTESLSRRSLQSTSERQGWRQTDGRSNSSCFDDASNPAVARANAQAIATARAPPCSDIFSAPPRSQPRRHTRCANPGADGKRGCRRSNIGNEYYFRALTPISSRRARLRNICAL